MGPHASLWGSGMLDSTLLMSAAPKPVAVRACFGLVKSGPTGPLSSDMGALVEGLRSLFWVPLVVDMMLDEPAMPHVQCSRKCNAEGETKVIRTQEAG